MEIECKTDIHPALVGSLSKAPSAERLINFGPGPTSLPKEVEKKNSRKF